MTSHDTLVKRYWSAVVRCVHEPCCPYCCWGWDSTRNPTGYGLLGYYSAETAHVQTISAHRFSWQIHNNVSIPKGLQCLHRCNNPPCSNPLHLYVGTAKDNTQDAINAGTHVSLRPERPSTLGEQHWTRRYPEKARLHAERYLVERRRAFSGAQNPKAKLTQGDVDTIRVLRAEGFSTYQLARMFPVSRSQISRICNYLLWK